jgi:hypothetical protein
VFDVLSLSDTSLFSPFCSNWKGRNRCAFAARAVCLLRMHLVDAPACTKMGRLSLCVVFRLTSFSERDREKEKGRERDRETERQRDIRDRVAETRTLAQAVFFGEGPHAPSCLFFTCARATRGVGVAQNPRSLRQRCLLGSRCGKGYVITSGSRARRPVFRFEPRYGTDRWRAQIDYGREDASTLETVQNLGQLLGSRSQ